MEDLVEEKYSSNEMGNQLKAEGIDQEEERDWRWKMGGGTVHEGDIEERKPHCEWIIIYPDNQFWQMQINKDWEKCEVEKNIKSTLFFFFLIWGMKNRKGLERWYENMGRSKRDDRELLSEIEEHMTVVRSCMGSQISWTTLEADARNLRQV